MNEYRPNTPGVGGYLLAWLVSVLAFSAALAQPWRTSETWPRPLADRIADVFALSIWVAVFSVLFASWAIPFVHYLCREVESQLVHVLAAGMAGVVAAGAAMMLFGPFMLVMAPWLALSTAIGRAAVVPLVWWRRAAAERAPVSSGASCR